MRFVRWRAVVIGAVVAASAALVSGCTTPDPVGTPKPTAPAEPVFASDEEALAAAEQAYADYLAMSDLVAQEGGVDPERLRSLVTAEFLQAEIVGFADYAADGLRQVGMSTSDSYSLQAATLTMEDFQLRVYLCLDVSETDVLNDDGESVVAEDRPSRLPIEVDFALAKDQVGILVSEPTVWDGTDYC